MKVTVTGTAAPADAPGREPIDDEVWAPFEGSWEGVLYPGQAEGQPFNVHVSYLYSDLNMWQAQLELLWEGCSAPLRAVAEVSDTWGEGQPAVWAEVGESAPSWGEFCPDYEFLQFKMLPDDTLEFSLYDGVDHILPIASPMTRMDD